MSRIDLLSALKQKGLLKPYPTKCITEIKACVAYLVGLKGPGKWMEKE